MSIVDPIRDERGWAFTGAPGTTADEVNGWTYLSEGYVASDPDFDARVTVPVLWDKQTQRIVNNESADIIVMLNSAFDEFAARPGARPLPCRAARRDRRDQRRRSTRTSTTACTASGFASTQEAYEEAVFPLVRDARRARRAARDAPLPRRRSADARRLAPVHDAAALRPGVRRALQVQPAPHRRLPEPVRLPARPLPDARRRRARSTLDQIKRHYYMTHGGHQPERHRPGRPGARPRRTARPRGARRLSAAHAIDGALTPDIGVRRHGLRQRGSGAQAAAKRSAHAPERPRRSARRSSVAIVVMPSRSAAAITDASTVPSPDRGSARQAGRSAASRWRRRSR